MTDLPTYADGTIIEHVAYPHEPGRLHYCLACEMQCHCTPGSAECIYEGEHKTFETYRVEPTTAQES